ncbi:MAG: transposase [Actinobacteria bacterium]|nr:transposase [Actinomycetota bacterium]
MLASRVGCGRWHRGVVDAVWAAVQPLLPSRPSDAHPLGCHQPRIADRDRFEALLVRLVTGCSWRTTAALSGMSGTTLRRRRDEWVTAGGVRDAGR